MNNSRFFKISLVLLLLINIGTLSFFWTNSHSMHRPPRQDVFSFLCRELKLDDRQKQQYETLRNEHHQAIEHLQQQNHQLRNRLFSMLNASPVDSMAVKQITDSISSVQEQIEMATFYHFRKVRAILRPEQQERFDNVIEDALRMMAPPQPPPPPR